MAQFTGAPRAPVGVPTLRSRHHRSRALMPLALRNAGYRRVWVGIAFLFFARWMEVASFSWLAVERTHNPFAIAMVGFARIMPFFLLGPLGGLVADRFNRRHIQIAARLSMAAISVAAAVLLWLDAMQLWHIYLFGVLSGVIMSLEVPARRAFTIDVVGNHAVTSGVAFDQLAVMSTLLIGPNVAGLMLPVVHGAIIFVIIGLLYTISALVLPRAPKRRMAVAAREGVFSSLRSGVNIVRKNRALAGALIAVGVTNMFGFAFFPLIPYFARDVLNTGSAGLGLLISAEAAGGVIAVLLIAQVGNHFRHHGRAIIAFAALCHVTGFGLAFAPSLIGTFGLLALAGGFAAALSMMQANLLMIVTPPQARGRLVGVEMVFGGAYPLGSLLVGGLAGAISPFVAIVMLSAIGLAITLAVGLAMPALRARTVAPSAAPA